MATKYSGVRWRANDVNGGGEPTVEFVIPIPIPITKLVFTAATVPLGAIIIIWPDGILAYGL